MKKLHLIAVAALLGGCATVYQKAEPYGEGYYDSQLAENVFEVSFYVHDSSQAHMARDFAMLRASELTLEHGFSYFSVIGEGQESQESHIAVNGTTVTFPNAATGGTYSYTTPASVVSSTDLNAVKRIMCYKDKPEGVVVYDARYVSKSIKEKYGTWESEVSETKPTRNTKKIEKKPTKDSE